MSHFISTYRNNICNVGWLAGPYGSTRFQFPIYNEISSAFIIDFYLFRYALTQNTQLSRILIPPYIWIHPKYARWSFLKVNSEGRPIPLHHCFYAMRLNKFVLSVGWMGVTVWINSNLIYEKFALIRNSATTSEWINSWQIHLSRCNCK